MALIDAYLVTTKNLEALFNAIQSGQAPERFAYKFLEQLGFSSSNDRLYIKIFKSLKFIDDSGVPLQRYYDFLDQTQSKAILAKSIQEAYEDLFVLNKEAWKMSREEIQNKLRKLTQGKKSDNVISLMAGTFESLCEYADWEGLAKLTKPEEERPEEEKEKPPEKPISFPPTPAEVGHAQLHYNIQIHLPESRDAKVYDAIFESLKKHLL